ncbi:MAG: polyketide synthase dehydratase domain-containing protein, partial [Candidatus Sulfotelmatobacter sp.]
PFKFYRNEARAVNIVVQIHPRGDQMLAECQLIGHRSLPTQTEPQTTTHFTARVRLAKGPVPAKVASAFVAPSTDGIQAADIYRIYFHGPAYQVLDEAWWDGTRAIGLFANALPPNHHPSERPTLMAPRLIEFCFQTAGIWELGAESRMGLPQHLLEVSLLREPSLAAGRLYAVVTRGTVEGTFNAEVLDKKGNCYLHLTGYQTVALPDAIDAQRLEKLRAIVPEDALVAV